MATGDRERVVNSLQYECFVCEQGIGESERV